MIHLGPYTFDRVEYDAESDVLYMSVGKSRPAYDAPDTPEGHGLRYAENNELIGVTLVNAKWWLEKEGEIKVTLPQSPAVADTLEIEAALAT